MSFLESIGWITLGAVYGSWMQERIPLHRGGRWLLGVVGFALLVIAAVME